MSSKTTIIDNLLSLTFSSAFTGLQISLDYWWTLHGLEENSDRYNELIKPCHQRSADRLYHGCIKHGGLFVKLGQGLASMNHILPEEYVTTLHKLEDQALVRRPNEVRIRPKAFFTVFSFGKVCVGIKFRISDLGPIS